MSSSAFADKAPCAKREAGAGYPWQNLDVMPGDGYAWIYIDIDKTGRALKCSIGKTDISDPETKFRLCQAYKEDWHGPAAAAADPPIRTIKKHFTMLGYNHQMADQRARKLWFKQHPQERQECYPD